MKTTSEATPHSQPWHDLPDKALLDLFQAAQSDDQLAEEIFNLLYSRHATPIWHFIRYRVSPVENAEDIFVETWRRAIEGMLTLTLQTSFRGWLRGIARHTIAHYYPRRKSGSRPDEPLQPGSRSSIWADTSLDELLINLDGNLGLLIEAVQDRGTHINPVLSYSRQEEIALLIGQALPQLKKRSASGYEIIYLAYFAGLSNAEIAAELKKSVGAIKTAKSRAHHYLAEIIRSLLDGMDEDLSWFQELR